MYLSQIVLNAFHPAARADISNPYELHRTVLSVFPEDLPERERVLFRLETVGRDCQPLHPRLLVQSIERPDWGRLAARSPGYLHGEPLVKSLAGLEFSPGQALRFRLRANPSKRDPSSGKRVGLYTFEDRLEWLQRKSQTSGFQLAEGSLNIREAGFRTFRKKTGKEPVNITLNVVDYDGWLGVQDPGRLLENLKKGIGPAKGLGCGLLSLANA